MSESIHPKTNGTRTVIGKTGIVGNLPSDKAKIAPTAVTVIPREAVPEDAQTNTAYRQVALVALRARLEKAWSEETSAGGYTPETPSTGQCVPTSLVVQDMFGGELLRVINTGISHYFNRLDDGTEIDLTRDQFPVWDPEPFVIRDRDYLAQSEWSVARYRILCNKLGLESAL